MQAVMWTNRPPPVHRSSSLHTCTTQLVTDAGPSDRVVSAACVVRWWTAWASSCCGVPRADHYPHTRRLESHWTPTTDGVSAFAHAETGIHICILEKVLDTSAAYGLSGALMKYLCSTLNLRLIQTKGWNKILFTDWHLWGFFFPLTDVRNCRSH